MRVTFHIRDPRRYKGTGVTMCSFATIDAGRYEPPAIRRYRISMAGYRGEGIFVRIEMHPRSKHQS